MNDVSILNTLPPDWPGGFWWHWVLFTVIIIAAVIVMVMGYTYIAPSA
jgi:hypothetical protein